jgi:hypothetical protein
MAKAAHDEELRAAFEKREPANLVTTTSEGHHDLAAE